MLTSTQTQCVYYHKTGKPNHNLSFSRFMSLSKTKLNTLAKSITISFTFYIQESTNSIYTTRTQNTEQVP